MTKELNNFTHYSKLDLIKMYKKSRRDVRRLSRQKVELKQQIEKMKCCTNCKHTRTEYKHCLTEKLEKWELKE